MNTQPTTTYTVRTKKMDLLMLFSYDLDGELKSFTIEQGSMNKEQKKWLYNVEHFPYNEDIMTGGWMKVRTNFEITVGEPDISFDRFWQLYNYKVKRLASERAWNRLSKKDKIDAIRHIKRYEYYLWKKEVAKAHAATYINQRYWEDEY